MKSVKPKPSKQKKQINDFGSFSWKKNILPSLIIFITGVSLYISTSSFEYVLDDKMIITDNIFTNQGFAGIGKIFSEESFTGYFKSQQNLVAGSRYRPLSIATFAIEKNFFQKPLEDGYGNLKKDAQGNQLITGDPSVSHIINAILYGLTGLLLFRVLFILFPVNPNNKWFITIPFAAAIIFITHPVHTEVIANIKSRDEIFALLFSLASLYYILRYQYEKRITWIFLTILCFFLALLSKESALAFIIIIPLTIYFFTKKDNKTILRSTIPFLIVLFVYLVIRLKVIGHFINKADENNLMNNPFFGMNVGQRLATILYTLGCYVKLIFIPNPLTNDYYPYAIPIMSFGDWRTILSILLYICLGYLVIKGFRKKNPLSYSILFFLLGLFLVSNIIFPVGSFMNERFIYISSIGYCIAIAYLLLEKIPGLISQHSQKIRLAGMGIITSIAVIYSVLTINRLPAWKNNYTLFETDVVTSSNSAFSNCFMGVGLYQKFLQTKDDSTKKDIIKKAESYERKALSIYPAYDEALHNLSGVVVKEFDYDKDVDKLLNTFSDILSKKNKSDYIDSYLLWMNGQQIYNSNLLPFYHKLGYEIFFKQLRKNDKARKYIEMGLQIAPDNVVLNKDMNEIETGSPFNN